MGIGIVIRNSKTETLWIDVPVSPDQQSREDRLCEKVKNTIKDGLRIWSNDVSSFTQSPCDWVECPDGKCPDTGHKECAMDVGAEVLCVLAAIDGKFVEDGKHGNAAEGVETKLVAGLDECADQTSDDHNFVKEDHVGDRWPWESSSQHQVEEKKWCGNDPVDITCVEDRSVDTSDNWI